MPDGAVVRSGKRWHDFVVDWELDEMVEVVEVDKSIETGSSEDVRDELGTELAGRR